MSNRTWSSSGSNAMETTTNYSGSGSFATDDLIFNGTSVVNATAGADIICNSITITVAYTGVWTIAGHVATLTSNLSVAGTGTVSFASTLSVGGNVSFSGSGTISLSSSTLTMTGAKTLTFGSGPTYSTYLSTIILQNNMAVVVNTPIVISRLQTKTIDTTITWTATGANHLDVLNYTAGDIGGTLSHPVEWKSSSPGTRYNVNLPCVLA